MAGIRIIRRNSNMELVSKLMNSVAVKYGCRVKYNTEKGVLNFFGDEACKRFIAEETMNLFAKAA